ncbi:MAG: hypothetical protein ABI573_06445 [Chloroflexota bacterium]
MKIRRRLRRLFRLILGTGFAVLLLAIAVGSAGVVALWSHPPGTAARAELTWAGDTKLGGDLDRAQTELGTIAADTDRLAVLARGALASLTSSDQQPFAEALTEGTSLADTIETNSAALRDALAALPGGSPADVLGYNAEVLAKRAGLLSALDATAGLSQSWVTLTSRSLQASRLIDLLASHDATVASAAARGRSSDYLGALTTLDAATAQLDEALDIRNKLANTTDVSTLDEWMRRNRRYDKALMDLYGALRDSGGVINDAVRAAFHEEGLARVDLPPDTKGIVVILADVGQGGLNQAVIAIDQARAHLALSLDALGAIGALGSLDEAVSPDRATGLDAARRDARAMLARAAPDLATFG